MNGLLSAWKTNWLDEKASERVNQQMNCVNWIMNQLLNESMDGLLREYIKKVENEYMKWLTEWTKSIWITKLIHEGTEWMSEYFIDRICLMNE